MSIFEKIKQLFRRNKNEIKLLPEGEKNRADDFRKSLYVGNEEMFKQHSLEQCIDEFIKQYNIQEIYNPDGSNKKYKAFTRMFCEEEEMGDNLKNQLRLVKLAKKYGFQTANQISNDRLVYLHIMGNKGVEEINPKMEKIYINCQRKDISTLTAAIFKQIKDLTGDKLQMKCVAEQILDLGQDEETKYLKNYQRNDKIVIYAENHNMAEKICESINMLKNNNPKLFNGIKEIPLLKKENGFMVCANKKYGEYVETPVGIASGNTYNDYISDILYQSVIAGFDNELNVFGKNYELSERMREYSRVYPEMSDEQKTSIISNCKKIFEEVCKEANIKTDNNSKRIDEYSMEK